MKIILWGYMGTGKTTIGKALAKTLQYPFFDLDNEIEKNVGLSVSEIFKTKGELFFRKKENEILSSILSNNSQFILSLGGGTPMYFNTSKYLNQLDDVLTINLSAQVSTLTNRLFPERYKRPLINYCKTKEELNDFIKKHLFERMQLYHSATITINIDDKSINKIVSEIVLQLF